MRHATTRPAALPALLALLLLACCVPVAFAQDATGGAPIEQSMTAEEFAAAGLAKLTPEELANLNAWLQGTLRVEAERAAAAAEEKVKDDNRGFFHFGSDEAIVARIVGRFEGFGQDRRYTLDNGQVWRQTDSRRLPGVRLDNPQVTIKPGMFSAWFMQVEGYNTSAKVERIK